MLKKHSQLFENLLFLSDLAVIGISWLLSYHLRFRTGLFPAPKGVPDLLAYCSLLLPILAIWAFAFKFFGLYRPKRIGSQLSEIADIAKACAVSMLVFTAFTFFLRQFDISRLVFFIFTLINIAALSLERLIFRASLKLLRRQGYNLRDAIVIGIGTSARTLIERVEKHPEIGVRIAGLVSIDELDKDRLISGIRVLESIKQVRGVIRDKRIDIVFIALPWGEHAKVEEALKAIGDEAVDIKVIPDLLEFMTLRGGAEEFEGLPILNIQNSPLYGWNIIAKRSFDMVFAALAILAVSPLMLAIAALIKASSRGPVLYRQERMGIGGDTFNMLKFRTMRIDAERDSGAVWTVKDDPRRTWLGALLRATSLDELPQLFNVLHGDMSLVGPRPERPVFIEAFRKEIPRYMLRHKMKTGITGWAQVNGWRGNTDLTKRIEHDLFYIEHWSMVFDLKILLLTFWKGFLNRNAY